MKVKDLMKVLRGLDKNREVVLQRDPEGNGYAEAYSCWTGAYSKRTGDAGLESLTQSNRDDGYREDAVIEDGIPAVILVPIR